MEDGDQIKFSGCSDEKPNAETCDLIILLHLRKHQIFIRKHDNLLMSKKITLSEALTETKFLFDHLDGRKIVVASEKNNIITPNSIKIIPQKGMPRRGNHARKFNIYKHSFNFHDFRK